MKIRRKYTPIYTRRDRAAAPEDRPQRHGAAALDPGSKSRASLPEGYTIPVSQTLPNVELRRGPVGARHRHALVPADARRRRRRRPAAGRRPAPVAARSSASSRPAATLARLNGAARAPPGEHPPHDPQLPAARRRRSATRTTSSRRSSTHRTRLPRVRRPGRAARASRCELLPGTLSTTNTALQKADALGNELGPTLGRLRPAARALGPTLQRGAAVPAPRRRRSSENQLRPFARDVLPTVRDLRPAAADLAAVTPRLTTSFGVVNQLLNELAYNPPGTEEGFLFWASWAEPRRRLDLHHAGRARPDPPRRSS